MEEDQQESDANATKQASRALLRASEPPQTVQTVREGSAEAARSSPPPPAQRPQLPPPPALRLPSLSKRLSLSKAPVTHSLKHYQSSPPSIYKESWDDSSRYKASSSAPKPGGLLVSYNATFMDQKKAYMNPPVSPFGISLSKRRGFQKLPANWGKFIRNTYNSASPTVTLYSSSHFTRILVRSPSAGKAGAATFPSAATPRSGEPKCSQEATVPNKRSAAARSQTKANSGRSAAIV